MDTLTGWEASAETLAFHQQCFVIDGLALDYILHEPYTQRVLEGGVSAAHTTFAIEEDWESTLAKVERNLEAIDRSPLLQLARNTAELEQARAAGRLGIVMGFQSATMVGRDLPRLGLLWRLGLRCVQLTYTGANLYGDGCGERRDAGLSFLGREFVDAVNELPLLLDLSHCGHATSMEAAERARAPVVTHANAYTVQANDRNKRDEVIRAVVSKNGVVGLCALPRPVHPDHPTLDHLVAHCRHMTRTAGVDHVGIGLDFIEGLQDQKVVLPESRRWRTLRPDIFGSVEDFRSQSFPRGLESIRFLPRLTQALLDRGYEKSEVAGILGENWLRVFRRTFDGPDAGVKASDKTGRVK